MRKKNRILLLSLAAVLTLGAGACAPSAPDAGQTKAQAGTEVSAGTESLAGAESSAGAEGALVDIDDSLVSLDSKPQKNLVRIPTASRTVTYGNDTVSVDASNVQNGYVMIQYTGSVKKIKVQISKGDLTYTYDLNARDAYEVFPM